VRTGLEQLLDSPPSWLPKRRVGLLCNPASVDHRFRHARMLIQQRFPGALTALYSPQHGFFAEKQDNMIESADTVDAVLGLPVYSLYSNRRRPTRAMFDPIDVLLVDLQDVGTRVYTFAYSMAYCMEAAKAFEKQVVILDRPNPIGGCRIEGNCLSMHLRSFVGRYPIPMRHGLTIGELALLFNDAYALGCALKVVPMARWHRSMLFEDTGLPWIAPSPNMPTPMSAAVYPGQVLWEGTQVSEGRGTTQPFEIFGAPFFDPGAISARLTPEEVTGITLRPMAFEPTWNKYAGQVCRGFQIHIADAARYRPYRCTLELLRAAAHLYPDSFSWKPPPYEYEYEKMPFDLICGDPLLRSRIAANEPIAAIAADWAQELRAFDALRSRFFLYD
jgi:uncharacterized protein YbbC (DUF1343 family)